VKADATILRIHLSKGSAKLRENCDIMIDQVRAIDNRRLLKKIGDLPEEKISMMKENMSIMLDL
jgi:mRNA interferase MazF